MKYFVNVNQAAAAQLGDLDLVDCAIIDWLMAICNSKSEAIQKERIGVKTWIRYSHLLSDMPLLGLKSREAVRKRLTHLMRRGYISMDLIGQRVYVELKVKCELLIVDNMWKIEAENKKVSTAVDGIKKPSTQGDGQYYKTISNKRQGSTGTWNSQGSQPGLARFKAMKASLKEKRVGG